MDISYDDLQWYWFKGNEMPSRLLQDLCLYRSHVICDFGTRKNFGYLGKNFGDIRYADFESYHIILCRKDEVLGSVRVTPGIVETVAASVLGETDYMNLINHLEVSLDKVIEINRLLIDYRVRRLNLGRILMYAAIGLIENVWDRKEMTIIGSAGNCTKQTQFFLNYTDYEKIPNVADKYTKDFDDTITFLKYRQAPYDKGADKIEFFKELFKNPTPFPWSRLRTGYVEQTELRQLET